MPECIIPYRIRLCDARFLRRTIVKIGSISAGQLFIGKPLAYRQSERGNKPLSIRDLAIVEPERLFIDVLGKVERFYAHVGSAQRPLEKGEVVLKPIGMNRAFGVLHGVVYKGVCELSRKAPVA